MLHLAVQLGGGGLVKLDTVCEASCADGLQHVHHTLKISRHLLHAAGEFLAGKHVLDFAEQLKMRMCPT